LKNVRDKFPDLSVLEFILPGYEILQDPFWALREGGPQAKTITFFTGGWRMTASSRGTKTLEEVKQSLRDRLREHGNPMKLCDKAQAAATIEQLKSLDGEHWGSIWGAVGGRFAQAAREAEARGDDKAAAEAHFQAYAFYYIGRYPSPNHPKKGECAREARKHFVAASRSFDPPLEKCVIPFAGRPGEGNEIITYLRKPKGIVRPPVVVIWGGIDGYKEERYENEKAILAAGMATLSMDTPGTGESPVSVSIDAERQYTPVFEWVRKRSDLDGYRLAVVGSSFGGYWATKVAHTHRQYLKGAVNWGGGVHYFFEADWLEKSQYADSYLMDLAETRAFVFNLPSYKEVIASAHILSLLNQGLLDKPCASLLLVNGKDDRQTPIREFYLLSEYGDPKSIRVFPGGHMGNTPSTLPTIVKWLADRLGS
jgi:esterase FrsA